MDLMKLKMSTGGDKLTAFVNLPAQITLDGLYDASVTLMEKAAEEHAFRVSGQEKEIDASLEAELHARDLLLTSDGLVLKFDETEIVYSLLKSPFVSGLKVTIRDISGNQTSRGILEANLQALFSEDESTETDKKKDPVILQMNSGKRKTISDKLDKKEHKIEDYPQFMQEMYKRGDYTIGENGAIMLNGREWLEVKRKEYVKINPGPNTKVHVAAGTQSVYDGMCGLTISQLHEFCRFLSIPLKSGADVKTGARVLHDYLMHNPRYWFYIIRPENLNTMRLLVRSVGKTIAHGEIEGDIVELLQYGLIMFEVSRKEVTIQVPTDLSVVLEAMNKENETEIYSLLDKADDTLRKWLNLYGMLPMEALKQLGGPGIESFENLKSLLSYIRFHGYSLNDIRTLQMTEPKKMAPIPYVASTEFDFQNYTKQIMSSKSGKLWKEFSKKDQKLALSGHPEDITPYFRRLKEFLRILAAGKLNPLGEDKLEKLFGDIYYGIVSAYDAGTIMNTISRSFSGFTPTQCGILYLLVLDCCLHMPIASSCGFPRCECKTMPMMSGIIDIDCEVEFKGAANQLKPMYMHDYMHQALFFSALNASCHGDPLKELRQFEPVVNGAKNPEYQLYLLFALIAYHRHAEIPAQLALVRKMTKINPEIIDWFVEEAGKRMREIPDEERRNYESYYNKTDSGSFFEVDDFENNDDLDEDER